MEDRKDIIEELNDILAKNYDSVKGFQKAAENANSNRLMGYFNEQVIARKRFVDELSAEVRSLGGEPTTDGTIQGTLHRGWIDFKTALSFEKDEDTIEACITGEKNCVGEYNDLLEETNIPVSTRTLLNRQKMSILNTIMQLEKKEEAYDS